jgi:flagellar protein FliS
MNIADPRKAYRQSSIHSESAADIFIQLYEQLSSLLYSAALAVETRDIHKKSADLNRAFTILIHLKGAVDFERGGEVALNLNQFYKLVYKEISEGSVKLDAAMLRQAAAHVTELRNVWDEAQALSVRQDAGASTTPPLPTQASDSHSFADSSGQDADSGPRGWNA